ncbi:hypothetical protein [Ideonella sp. BN130291]|uniref:hypothetical protein n=1 Tax=Ideonella sp. BN130291 TaxID=3112940 RepID=UPI002E253123|nr:hypothetical protein [Ideonella sp. BN130291]
MTAVQPMHRNLSLEAHLWYTATSSSFMTRPRDLAQEAVVTLLGGVSSNPWVADYRPVPYWGGVLESLLQTFDSAKAALDHGEFDPMISWGGRLEDVPRGLREGNVNWMEGDLQALFLDQLNGAYSVCSTFWFALVMSQMYTSDSYKNGTEDWRTCVPHDLGRPSDFILNSQEELLTSTTTAIPEYRADTTMSCRTGDIVPWSGVWVPSTGMGRAALVFARQGIQIMQPAYEVLSIDEDYGTADEFELIEAVWHPVRPTGRTVMLKPNDETSSSSGRVEAGHPAGGRRHFQQAR